MFCPWSARDFFFVFVFEDSYLDGKEPASLSATVCCLDKISPLFFFAFPSRRLDEIVIFKLTRIPVIRRELFALKQSKLNSLLLLLLSFHGYNVLSFGLLRALPCHFVQWRQGTTNNNGALQCCPTFAQSVANRDRSARFDNSGQKYLELCVPRPPLMWNIPRETEANCFFFLCTRD